MRKRQSKKILKIVADNLRAGKPLHPLHYHFACNSYGNYVDRLYITEFRPWWYDQDWSKFDLSAEIRRHYEKSGREFEQMTGINLDALSDYQNQLPKRKRARKPRKEKPVLVRKLRRPEEFEIARPDRTRIKVIGEKVFTIGGYDFFIYFYHETRQWVVTDVITGALIKQDDRYKRAVKRAREHIETHFNEYLKFIERMNQ